MAHRVITKLRLGALASRVYPGLDEALFNRRRNAQMRGEIEAGNYGVLLADLPTLIGTPAVGGSLGRPSHLVVVPQVGPNTDDWMAAGGNFFYEIAQSAREYAGVDKVTLFAVAADEAPADWHARVIRFLVTSGATHLIIQAECDPNTHGSRNTWDTFLSQLSTRWDGVMLGLVTDSSFTWITAAVRRLGVISQNFVLVDICMPMDGSMKRGRPEVGPVNMPVSNESLAVIDARIDGLPKRYDVSFIGALYPYRVELLDRLRSMGVNVAVNPHRPDVTHDFHQTRKNQPTYVDYMAGLAQSHMTINFSRSSAGEFQQLKTRVLEASAVGCVVLTDDVDRTDRFWVAEEEYAHFTDPSELPDVVTRFLGDPVKLAAAQVKARARARAINVTSFWGGIDDVLRRRGLPTLDSE